jgi:hypothetical protein
MATGVERGCSVGRGGEALGTSSLAPRGGWYLCEDYEGRGESAPLPVFPAGSANDDGAHERAFHATSRTLPGGSQPRPRTRPDWSARGYWWRCGFGTAQLEREAWQL